MSEHGIKEMSNFQSIKMLFDRFLQRYWKLILILVLFNLILGFLQTVKPLTLSPAANVILGDAEKPAASISEVTLNNIVATLMSILELDRDSLVKTVLVFCSIYVVLNVLIAILHIISFSLSAWIQSNVLRNMITTLHSHLLSLPISYFQKQQSGILVSRFTANARETSVSLDSLLQKILGSSIQIIFYLIILAKTEPLLTICVFGIGSIHFLITRSLSNLVRHKTLKAYDFLARMAAVLQEVFQNIRIIKSFAAEEFDKKRIRRITGSVRKSFYHLKLARYIEEPIRLVTDALAVGGVLILGYYAMAQGRLTVSGFAMFVYLSHQLILPISVLSSNILGLSGLAGGARRILEMLKTHTDIVDGKDIVPWFSKSISLTNINFSYEKDVKVLKNINFEIQKNEMVAVVGPSGSGKSTLLDIILRLYDPLEGIVKFDGIDIRQFQLKSYLHCFGVVSQECLLFNASIRDNIIFGRQIDNEQFWESLHIANADDFINELSEGIDTEVGERGMRLSGGQVQRIAIARAWYGKPDILVLDEATSSLDSESERAVQIAIENVSKNVTSIVIAHRLSTIRNANKVIVLNKGRIEKIGTHESLLRDCPLYHNLYRMQIVDGE